MEIFKKANEYIFSQMSIDISIKLLCMYMLSNTVCICYQIISEEAKPIIILTNVPLILAYPLPYNMTLISSNYPIAFNII